MILQCSGFDPGGDLLPLPISFAAALSEICLCTQASKSDPSQRKLVRVYSVALPLVDDLRPHAAPHVRSERDRDEGARGEDMGCFGPLGPPTLACWNLAHSCLVQVPDAIL